MSAAFPIGALVRVATIKPHPRSSFGSLYGHGGGTYIVIGESWIVKGESELVDCEWTKAGEPVDGTGRIVTHPDWTCVPLVAVHSIAEARELDLSADELFRGWFGTEARIFFADVADLARDEVSA